MSLVSVIIATFNREILIVKAIESVLAQTFKDFELIVVDDGSTDSTAQVLAKYRDRITYLYQENKGPSAARNLGIKNANGAYVCFLDSDDLWHKDKLKIQLNAINHNPDIKICYTNEIWIRNGIRVNQKKIHQKYSGWIFQKCLPLCIISPSSVLINREVFDKIGLFDEDLIVCEDYDFWLRASIYYPITFIDKSLIIKYGGHQDQLSQKFWGMDRFRIIAIEKVLADKNLKRQDRKAAIETLKKKCTIIANGCFKRGKIGEGNKFLAIIERYDSHPTSSIT